MVALRGPCSLAHASGASNADRQLCFGQQGSSVGPDFTQNCVQGLARDSLGLKECLVGLGQKLVNARQPPAPLAGFAATSPKIERAPAAGQEAEARMGKAETG